MANVTVRMGSFAMACASGVIRHPVAREATVNPKSPLPRMTDNHFAVPLFGAGGGGGWTVIVVIDPVTDQIIGEVVSPRGGGRWNGLGYGTGLLVVVVSVSTPPPN